MTDEYFIRIAGISHHQDVAQQAAVGDACKLVPEPTNQFDPNAIQIVLLGDPNKESADQVLGYVPRDQTSGLLIALKSDCSIDACIHSAGFAGNTNIIGIVVKLVINYEADN